MSSTSPSFAIFLQYLMSVGPTMLVAVVGLLLTVVNWRQLGRAAPLAAGGCGLHLFASLSYLLVSGLILPALGTGNSAGTMMSYRILNVVNGTLHAAALALLLAALLAPRPPAA